MGKRSCILALLATPPIYAQFVATQNGRLVLDGEPFRFAGANAYYLMYAPPAQVDQILSMAASNDLKVLRIWSWLDIGNRDGSQSVHGKMNGVYFQYWDGDRPAYNDGADGLERLDYVIHRAAHHGVRLVIPFTNNWRDFGGMDQYVRWRGASTHSDFYTDPVIRQWYRKWIAHLLNRVNTYSGIAYKDDTTILSWELANEPRCKGSGVYPVSPSCTTATVSDWAGDVSAFVKSVDPNHLLAVGDEGFYCIPGSRDWIDNCSEGVDSKALSRLPSIDWVSFHLYPESWNRTADWSRDWIASHLRDARDIAKPALFGEFGFEKGDRRAPLYNEWTALTRDGGGLFWMLAPRTTFDGLDIACPNAVCLTMRNFSAQLGSLEPLEFPPVADDNQYATEFEAPIRVNPAANDFAYGGARLARIKLEDTATGGTFDVAPDGMVEFAPAAGFNGLAQVSYTIEDDRGRKSNSAAIRVTVSPKPGSALSLFSFETGAEGWSAGSWQADAGTAAVSDGWAADGRRSLKIVTASGGWFGVVFQPALNLAGRSQLGFTIRTLDKATSLNASIKVGNAFTWCEGLWGSMPGDREQTVTLDLRAMSCGTPDLSSVREVYVWFSGGGTYYLDRVVAQ